MKRLLLSVSLLLTFFAATVVSAQPGSLSSATAAGPKYPLNGQWTRQATQLSRIESNVGQGLVQQLFKKQILQQCDFRTIFWRGGSWPWRPYSAIPVGYVKYLSTLWYTVYINPECACGAHEQKLTLLEADTDQSPEVRLACDINPSQQGNREYLYNQGDMEQLPIGTEDMMNTSGAANNDEISIEADICIPDCQNPQTVPSYGPNAIVFLQGDNVEEKAVAKGLTLGQAQDGRVLGGAALAPYVDVNGNIDFGAKALTTLVIIYEQDGANEADSNWAWDDHMQLVDACGGVVDDTPPPPVEYNLRQDGTGVDASCWNIQSNACTDGQFAVGAHSIPNPLRYEIGLVKLVITEPTTITAVRGVANNINSDWVDINPELNIWSSETAAAANPFQGDVYADHTSVSIESSTPPTFGGIANVSSYVNHYVGFTFPEFQLQPGTYWVSLINNNSGMGTSGLFWALTTTDLGSDSILIDTFPGQAKNLEIDFGMDPNTVAMDVFGYPSP